MKTKSRFQKRAIDYDTYEANFKVFQLPMEWQLRMFLNYLACSIRCLPPRRHSSPVSLPREIVSICLLFGLSECHMTTINIKLPSPPATWQLPHGILFPHLHFNAPKTVACPVGVRVRSNIHNTPIACRVLKKW